MSEIRLCLPKDKFGFNSFRSFIDHVDYYQHVQHIQFGTKIVKFNYTQNGIPIYDIFELLEKNKFDFATTNIIVVETLRQFLLISNKLDSTKKYIILSESYWDTLNYKFNLDYELIYVPWDIIDCQNRLANRSNLYFHLIDLDFLKNYEPQYDFLCLVGRSKPWRDSFVDKLVKEVDLTNSLTSYYGNCLGSPDLLDIDILFDRNNSKIEFENKFYKPISVGNNYNYNLSYFTKNELFYTTKFSVVVETEAELEEYHITEKTIKCLMLGHPFVVIGTPYYLKYLRNLGFETYNSIFDENYDNIFDLEERMNAIIKLIKDLRQINFNITDLEKIQQKNLNTIIKLRNKHTYEKFLGLFDV